MSIEEQIADLRARGVAEEWVLKIEEDMRASAEARRIARLGRIPDRASDAEALDLLGRVEECLVFLAARQTADERAARQTLHLNGQGFDAADGALVAFADAALRGERFPPRLRAALARCLVKYRRQLAPALSGEVQP